MAKKSRKKVALVLSGGGAKGAFQVAAEKYAREVRGYKWDVIAGVSAGALNGTMIAMGKYDRLEEIWRTISKKRIMKGRLSLWNMIKLAFGKKSVYSNQPLWELLQQEIDPGKINTDLRIGAVSLRTGKYHIFTPKDKNFSKAVLASTTIPLIWKPLHISETYLDMVDGGLRNMSPLGDVLDVHPDEVVVINCNPSEPEKVEKSFRNIIDIGKRALDITTNEIFQADVREFLRINKNVKEAKKKGITLHNEKGKAYKYFKCHVIEPDKSLGDTLDFSKESIEKQFRAGWRKAKKVLG